MDDIEDFLDTQSRRLVRPLESLRALGNDIGSAPEAEALERLRSACGFCSGTLLPLLEAHETLLDPAVTGLPGALDLGRALGAERLRLRGLVSALARRLGEGRLDPQARAALRRELYLLHAVTGVYLARLRALYVPLLLTRLDECSEKRLVDRLERTSHSSLLSSG